MTDQAVAVWTPEEATKSLTRAVSTQRTKKEIAALLGVDLESDDPKEKAKARAMLDRFVAVALHAATNPAIIRATQESIIQSIRDSALLGLEPVGVTGDGAIVVYEEKVKVERPAPSGRPGATIMVEERVKVAHFQPMYRGLLKLARRSDQLAHIDAHVVYQGDTIELDLGSQPSVKHFPVLDGSQRGDVVGAYAVAELTNGRRYVEWMTYADIEAVRKSSRAGTSGPWVNFWGEMARKTVLRRLMKRLPLETMAEHGLRIEAEAESRGVVVVEGSATTVDEAKPSEARKRLRARHVTEPPPEEDGAVAPLPPPEPTTEAETVDPAVLVDSGGGEPRNVTPPLVDHTVRSVPARTAGDEGGPVPTPVDVTPHEGEVVVPADVVEGVIREADLVDQGAHPDSPATARAVCGDDAPMDLFGPNAPTCVLEPGHKFPDGKPSAHQDKEGSRWPNS